MNLDEFKENVAPSLQVEGDNEDEKKNFKYKEGRFEFALYANEFVVCKRNFSINGYIEGSMQTLTFKDEIDKIVDIINDDLKSKTRTYVWYHNFPDTPEWDPEIMTDPLIDENTFMLRFAVYDNGKEVISRSWDARYYPSYIRNNIDITNKLVKLTKGENTVVYYRDKFFGDKETSISGELYVLKHMIWGKDDLIPIIQRCIYEICSTFGNYYDSIGQLATTLEYKTTKIRKDKHGNAVMRDKTFVGVDGNIYKEYNRDGTVKKVPVYDAIKGGAKVYYTNIAHYNKKLEREWAEAVKDKTNKYFETVFGPRNKKTK